MQDQKLEPLLNLALDAPREDFLRSQSLQTGYNPVTRTWKLIVRHSRDISEVDALGAKREELLNGYAILEAPEDRIDEISSLPQIEFVEKPKRLFLPTAGPGLLLACRRFKPAPLRRQEP